ncbi:MAG TPA: tetratricopeptide repeat protein [Terriglobia bacterium]|jgi:tetratricopeptide (TPR) repeat protein|nr:tetratricopeptide repeat protein [Terriglobia bacterium]
MLKSLFLVIVAFAFIAAALPAQQTEKLLLTQDEVLRLVKKNKNNPATIIRTLQEQGVDFDLDPKIEKRMRKAGADDEILNAIWSAGPTVRNFKGAVTTSATGKPLQSTYKEAMGFETLQNEQDPDTKIRMVQEFERQFPKSDLLSYVYTQAASAYEEKADYPNAVQYCRKSLELDPENTYSLLLMATVLSEPGMNRGPAAQTEKNLSEAKVDAERVLELLPKLPARKDETPEQLEVRKASIASDAHSALGSIAMLQGNLDVAINEFQQAIRLSSSPKATLYFRLGEIYSNAGKKQEAIDSFTKAAEIGKGTVIETYARQSIQQLNQNN